MAPVAPLSSFPVVTTASLDGALARLLGQDLLALVDGFFHTRDPSLQFFVPSETTDERYLVVRNGAIIYDAINVAPAPVVFQGVNGAPADGRYTMAITFPATPAFELQFVVDTSPPIKSPTIALLTDSGRSAADSITTVAEFRQPTSAEDFEPFESAPVTFGYSLLAADGSVATTYTTLDALNIGIDALTPTGSETALTVRAFKIDAAGNRGPETDFSFIVDTRAPDAPELFPTGVNEELAVIEPFDAITYYSYRIVGTTDWTASTTTRPVGLALGAYEIRAFAEDDAGNRSPETIVAVTVDRLETLPVPTDIDLTNDTGRSATDNITRNEAITVAVDAGNVAQFSYDNGVTWLDTQRTNLPDGTHTLVVRQVTMSADGEVTALSPASAPFSFVLDTNVAAINVPATVSLDAWLGLDGSGFSIDGTEPGALVEFQVDDGAWSSTRPLTDLDDGDVISIRQTDVAGNVSATDTLTLEVSSILSTTSINEMILNDASRSGLY